MIRRLLPLVLLPLSVAIAAPAPDFIDLARKAYPKNSAMDRTAADALWSAFFRLEKWHFLMTARSVQRKQPARVGIDGKSWFLAFTDEAKLRAYASSNDFLDPQGKAMFVSLSPEKAMAFLAEAEGGTTFGLRVNEGSEQGFFAPLGVLPRIQSHLKSKGQL